MSVTHYPKKVYIIFPFNEQGHIVGAYVGASFNVRRRLQCHLGTHCNQGLQTELHDLMRKNGFAYSIVDCIKTYVENYVEYDWIDFCERKLKLHVFNNQKGICGADWHRIGGVS